MRNKRFEALRISKGFSSQRQLAAQSGISNGSIAKLEKGTQKPTLETIHILAETMDVPLAELLDILGYEQVLEENESITLTQKEIQLIRCLRKEKELHDIFLHKPEEMITILAYLKTIL